jgi:hypothetical protein
MRYGEVLLRASRKGYFALGNKKKKRKRKIDAQEKNKSSLFHQLLFYWHEKPYFRRK